MVPKPRFLEALREWFLSNSRDLPWRRNRDPWRVLVSEILLQQTPVWAVRERFERFMERFPTPLSLAQAPVEEVLKEWEGLGYYRRALNLHRAASHIARKGFPTTPEGLESLPGVGPYTSSALLALAFRRPVAVVDGNVSRVVARFLGWKKRSIPRAQTWLSQWVEGEDPSVFAESWMEVGALLCRPRRPKCAQCPLRKECRAFRSGHPESWGVPTSRSRKKRESVFSLVVSDSKGRILLEKAGPLFHLWTPPLFPDHRSSLSGALRWRDFEILGPLGTLTHSFTNRLWRVEVFEGRFRRPSGIRRAGGVRWVGPRALEEVPLSSLARKILSLRGARAPKPSAPSRGRRL